MIAPLILIVVAGLLAMFLLGSVFWLLISTLLTGLVLGALGRLVVPGRQRVGLLATILIGWVGAIVGSLIGRSIGIDHLLTLLLEVGVAAVVVAGYSLSRRRRLPAGGRRSLGRI
jgi:uncharacterized membrane protein YeaQ/YmgE (transglycosylase-associated protein family)